MRKINHKSFENLVEMNKRQLLSDPEALEKIELKIEQRFESKLPKALKN